MQRLYQIAGVLSILGGAFTIWMAYCFASLVDPGLADAAGRPEVGHRLYGDRTSPIGLGILLIGVGIWLASSKPGPPA